MRTKWVRRDVEKKQINKNGISIQTVLLVPGRKNILHLKGNGDLFWGKILQSTSCVTYGSAADLVDHFTKHYYDNACPVQCR